MKNPIIIITVEARRFNTIRFLVIDLICLSMSSFFIGCINMTMDNGKIIRKRRLLHGNNIRDRFSPKEKEALPFSINIRPPLNIDEKSAIKEEMRNR